MFLINEHSTKVLTDQMCIDLKDLKEKIESAQVLKHAPVICNAIDTIFSFVGEKTADDVNEYRRPLIGNPEHEHEFLLDSVRMAFFRFMSGGLLDLFVYQENEAWFPKIQLTKVLTPNDIDSLDKDFLIYRGCDISEHENNCFGQS